MSQAPEKVPEDVPPPSTESQLEEEEKDIFTQVFGSEAMKDLPSVEEQNATQQFPTEIEAGAEEAALQLGPGAKEATTQPVVSEDPGDAQQAALESTSTITPVGLSEHHKALTGNSSFY